MRQVLGFFLGRSSLVLLLCAGCATPRPETNVNQEVAAESLPAELQAAALGPGDIIEIKGKQRGKPFYGCTNYASEQKCDFRIWQKPVKEDCPQCGSQFLVRGGTKKAPVLKCANGTCGFERELEDTDFGDEDEEKTPSRDLASNE